MSCQHAEVLSLLQQHFDKLKLELRKRRRLQLGPIKVFCHSNSKSKLSYQTSTTFPSLYHFNFYFLMQTYQTFMTALLTSRKPRVVDSATTNLRSLLGIHFLPWEKGELVSLEWLFPYYTNFYKGNFSCVPKFFRPAIQFLCH